MTLFTNKLTNRWTNANDYITSTEGGGNNTIIEGSITCGDCGLGKDKKLTMLESLWVKTAPNKILNVAWGDITQSLWYNFEVN